MEKQVGNLKLTAEVHTKKLNEYLDKIYSIKTPEILKPSKGETINVLVALEEHKALEEVYSVVEENSKGKIYEEYAAPLNKVRELISQLEDAKDSIEKEFGMDILNAKNLIEKFSKYL